MDVNAAYRCVVLHPCCCIQLVLERIWHISCETYHFPDFLPSLWPFSVFHLANNPEPTTSWWEKLLVRLYWCPAKKIQPGCVSFCANKTVWSLANFEFQSILARKRTRTEAVYKSYRKLMFWIINRFRSLTRNWSLLPRFFCVSAYFILLSYAKMSYLSFMHIVNCTPCSDGLFSNATLHLHYM